MSISIQPVDFESDQQLIIDALRRFLTPAADERRYQWLYMNNPHGRGHAWIAREVINRTVVGVAAAFPRRFLLKGAPHLAWVFGDFCVSEHYRSLGPAMQLQRALLTAAGGTPDLAGWYDFPSNSMAAVYRRLGVSEAGTFIRMASLLRADRTLLKLTKHSRIARAMAPLANLCLAIRIHVQAVDGSLVIAPYSGRFGSEFTDLAHEASPAYDVCIERSADYLNWRFLENPQEGYECLVARKSGRLCGYLVFSVAAEDAILVDLFSVKQESIIKSLLSALAKTLWRRGVMTISAPMVESHPWRRVLLESGYRDREGSPFVVGPGLEAGGQSFSTPHATWYLMHGDRDS